MNEQRANQLDAFATPGTVLKAAREAQGMSEREAADRLNLMPQYVALLERDEYQLLRSPSFARGYVKAYGRMLGVDERHLLRLYDTLRPIAPGGQPEIGRQRPLAPAVQSSWRVQARSGPPSFGPPSGPSGRWVE